MNWLLNLLRELFGLQKSQKKEPAPKADRPVEKPRSTQPVVKPQVSPPQPMVKVDGRKIFYELHPVVETLLKEMAQARWISDFRYEPDPDDLKWSTWKTDRNSFKTEHWTVRIVPASAQFRISANKVITSGLAVDEVKTVLAKAAQVGPATRNIPVENILDEQI